jgi:hypothetical protein
MLIKATIVPIRNYNLVHESCSVVNTENLNAWLREGSTGGAYNLSTGVSDIEH